VTGKPHKKTKCFFFLFLACNGSTSPVKIVSDKNTISSPLYPDFSPTEQTCTWLVIPPPGQVAGYLFIDYHLAIYDFVELRDGRNENATLLVQNTYRQKPENFWRTSNGQFLWVKFQSHLEFVKGFEMKIKFFKDLKGILTSIN